jgi:hypothetical protein
MLRAARGDGLHDGYPDALCIVVALESGSARRSPVEGVL